MQISEVILCKYGEVILKGQNRQNFESMMIKELRRRASRCGTFKIHSKQSTIYIEPLKDDADMDEMYESAKKVFGIVAVNRAAVCEKNMDSIISVAKEYLPAKLMGKKTFKVDARRSDKRFPLTTPEIMQSVGAAILESTKGIRVNVHDPDVIVTVEIRDEYA